MADTNQENRVVAGFAGTNTRFSFTDRLRPGIS